LDKAEGSAVGVRGKLENPSSSELPFWILGSTKLSSQFALYKVNLKTAIK